MSIINNNFFQKANQGPNFLCLSFILGLFIVLLYITPVLIQWEDAPVLDHDCLDSVMVYYINLADSGKVMGSYGENIDQMMGGISRNLFPSELNILTLIFLLFDPITGYFLNFSIVHIIAYLGMFSFLQQFVKSGREHPFIICGISSSFAILPFFPSIGLSIAGIPVVIFAFCSIIRDGWSIKPILLISFYSLYSSAVHIGYFLILTLLLICIIFSIYQKKIFIQGFFAVFFIGFIFCLCDYRLIWEIFFNSSFVSHRYEFSQLGVSFIDTIKIGYDLLSSGQYHAVSLHQMIIPIIWSSLGLMVFHRIVKRQNVSRFFVICGELMVLVFFLSNVTSWIDTSSIQFFIWISIFIFIILFFGFFFTDSSGINITKEELLIIALLFLILGICFIYQISSWNTFIQFKSSLLIIKALQLRFYYEIPFIWYLLFAVCSLYLLKYGNQSQFYVIGVIFVQILFLFSFHGGTYQTGGLGNILDDKYSFNEFFSPEIFSSIRDDIGLKQDSYRVASIGIHPAISLYNGFFTIDGYFYNYPLSYKQKFREVISPELNKSERWRTYYDGWGNRAYIFSPGLDGFTTSKDKGVILKGLELNITAFRNLGGKYLFSAVKLNPIPHGFTSFKRYNSERSPWEIWVYKLNRYN